MMKIQNYNSNGLREREVEVEAAERASVVIQVLELKENRSSFPEGNRLQCSRRSWAENSISETLMRL